jgi:GMP synthase-like glutamine amidotransferase
MRIGLIETDILYDDLISDYGSYGLMFEKYFSHLNCEQLNNGQRPCDNKPLEFSYYHVQQGELPKSLHECDAYIITGSKSGAYENHNWIQQLSKWVVKANDSKIKLLGICFGHQLIAHALGGMVEQSNKGWGVGVRTLATVSNPKTPLAEVLPKNVSLIYSHKDQIIRLPADATTFLSDDFCPCAGFTIDNHIITFQGHPEFTPEYTQRLLVHRAKVIGEPTYSQGMKSLIQKTDSELVGRMILNFLQAD